MNPHLNDGLRGTFKVRQVLTAGEGAAFLWGGAARSGDPHTPLGALWHGGPGPRGHAPAGIGAPLPDGFGRTKRDLG